VFLVYVGLSHYRSPAMACGMDPTVVNVRLGSSWPQQRRWSRLYLHHVSKNKDNRTLAHKTGSESAIPAGALTGPPPSSVQRPHQFH